MWKGFILPSAFISEKKRTLISRQNNQCILHTDYKYQSMWKEFHRMPDYLHRESAAYLQRSFTLHDDTIKESLSWSTLKYHHIWFAAFLAPLLPCSSLHWGWGHRYPKRSLSSTSGFELFGSRLFRSVGQGYFHEWHALSHKPSLSSIYPILKLPKI